MIDRPHRLPRDQGAGVGDAIYRGMIKDSRYPEGRFTGSPETLTTLRAAVSRTIGR